MSNSYKKILSCQKISKKKKLIQKSFSHLICSYYLAKARIPILANIVIATKTLYLYMLDGPVFNVKCYGFCDRQVRLPNTLAYPLTLDSYAFNANCDVFCDQWTCALAHPSIYWIVVYSMSNVIDKHVH